MKAVTHDEGQKLVNECVCGQCGAPLTMPWGGSYGYDSYVVRCGQDPQHEGFVKRKTATRAYDNGDPVPMEVADNIERKRRRKMAEQVGEQEEKALQPYYGVPALTQEQATMILKTIWPKAPDIEVFKAALICKMYGLNPLMKHLYLLEFKRKDGASTWAPVLGIQATRLIASRKYRYTYLDGPRMMTEEEQQEIRGKVDSDNIWAITKLRDTQGNEAPGYGSWPNGQTPYGTEKGNTKENMAMIRSERNAFDRLFPGEMPQEIDTIDAQFAPHDELPAPPKPKTLPPKEAPTAKPADDRLKQLRQQVHAKCASELGEDAYENLIRPKIVSAFHKASSTQLNETELSQVLNFIDEEVKKRTAQEKPLFLPEGEAKPERASAEDIQEVVMVMKGRKMTDEEIRNVFLKATDKKGGWTKHEITKVWEELNKMPDKPAETEETPDEIDEFIKGFSGGEEGTQAGQ